jgi:hypothetical protein
MSDTLHARRLNHGQSEVWLADESKGRLIATNAVYSAIRKHCSKEEFDKFYATTQTRLGSVAEVLAAGTLAHDLNLL